MAYSLFLLNDRNMRLAIFIFMLCISSLVQEKFSFVKIFLIPGNNIEFTQSHLRNLMSWNDYRLTWFISNLPANTISIFHGNIQKAFLPCSLIICYRSFKHMSQII